MSCRKNICNLDNFRLTNFNATIILLLMIIFKEVYIMNITNKKIPIIYTEEMGKKNIDIFEFTVRTANCLKRSNIMTVDDLIEKWESLDSIRGFGTKCKNEIKEKLVEMVIDYKGKEWFQKRFEELNGITEEKF